MTALPSSPRIAAPAYYHGRPVSFWITHLSPRRGGPRAAAPGQIPGPIADMIGALGPEALRVVTHVNG
jgi:hypothetical protein